jgi:hypothetical protein
VLWEHLRRRAPSVAPASAENVGELLNHVIGHAIRVAPSSRRSRLVDRRGVVADRAGPTALPRNINVCE